MIWVGWTVGAEGLRRVVSISGQDSLFVLPKVGSSTDVQLSWGPRGFSFPFRSRPFADLPLGFVHLRNERTDQPTLS
jgi:hypothetical protein